MSYTVNLTEWKCRLMLNIICVTLLSNFDDLLLLNMNKRGNTIKSLHFPGCPGAGHAGDVTISIYTTTGKNFFLHCYIVTNGAGAEPGRKASSRQKLCNILTPVEHQSDRR